MIGLLGLGTVGQGVYDILYSRKEKIKALAGKEIAVKKILIKDISKQREENVSKALLTRDPEIILNDDESYVYLQTSNLKHNTVEYLVKELKSKDYFYSRILKD